MQIDNHRLEETEYRRLSRNVVHEMKQLLAKLFRCKTSSFSGTLEDAVPASPAVVYVNYILFEMTESHMQKRVLRTSEPLTAITILGNTVAPPPLDVVVNRLKVMTGLNPVIYPTQVEGSLIVWVKGEDHTFTCQFDDNSDNRCMITMKPQGDAQQNHGA